MCARSDLVSLSKLKGGEPKPFPKGLCASNTYVYEVDAEKKSEQNPYGVGQFAGCITYPHGSRVKVKWMDGEHDLIETKYIKKCPQIGDIVHAAEIPCEVMSYSVKGVHLAAPKKPTTQQRSKKKQQPSKKKQQPSKKTQQPSKKTQQPSTTQQEKTAPEQKAPEQQQSTEQKAPEQQQSTEQKASEQQQSTKQKRRKKKWQENSVVAVE